MAGITLATSPVPQGGALALEDCWDEPAPPAPGGPADLEALQGAWVSASAGGEVELLVAGAHFTVRFKGGEVYVGSFGLDPASRPRRMDMRIEEGPARHKGQTARCIYHLDGDVLRWCAVRPGLGERLAAFPAADDPRYLGLVFRRERPR